MLLELGFPEEFNRRERQVLGVRCGFFTTDITARLQSLRHYEAVRRYAKTNMVVKPPPASSLIVTQSQILLQVLVVALIPDH